MSISIVGKILIVEKEAGTRLTLRDILICDGHDVTTAANGQAALELINKKEFDLALIDIKLGDMEGTEVLEQLHTQSPNTLIIMLTSYASLKTAVEALRQGAYDYLFKPCQTIELRQSIRQGLLKRQQKKQQNELLIQLEQNLAETLADIRATVLGNPPPENGEEDSTMESLAQSDPNLNLTLNLANNQQGRFLQQGGLVIDFSRRVIVLDGQLLKLSLTEFGLLAYLASESPRTIPPKELVYEVQGYESDPNEASEIVRAHIYNIRQKIKKTTHRTDIIQTIRGVGYAIHE